MTLEFKFNLDQKVVTAFGDQGIIDMLGYDEGGNRYYVKTKQSEQWYKEKDLSLAE